ncbi:MAG: hypothetical protein JRG92_22805 [Deltaproteobacteria bacterium]|nr:hypothetical protein [Deltaproteobacteria bacterium]
MTLNRSTISASAATGRGGTVRIVAGQFVQSSDSRITASGGDPSLDGQIIVEAPPQDLEQQLARLPSDFVDAADQLAVACEERTEGGGSLIERRHRELAPAPGSSLDARSSVRGKTRSEGSEEAIQ